MLQALEAIKVISRDPTKPVGDEEAKKMRKMTLFTALPEILFRHLQMRGRRAGCVACGEPDAPQKKITKEAMEDGRMDYIAFCGILDPVNLLKPDERVSVMEYKRVRQSGQPHMLIDVRDKTQFGICHLSGSLSMFMFPTIFLLIQIQCHLEPLMNQVKES